MADFDRFRSFAERYVIERAASFTRGNEQAEAWTAILDAKTIFRQIGVVSKDAEPGGDVQQFGNPVSSGRGWNGTPPGATGAAPTGPRQSGPNPKPPPPTTMAFGKNLKDLDANEINALMNDPSVDRIPGVRASLLQRMHQLIMGKVKP